MDFVLLRLHGERRGEEVERETDREPDPPHGHLGEGWLAGSLADECCRAELAPLVEHHVLLDELVRPH
jgi:hypothetical protein